MPYVIASTISRTAANTVTPGRNKAAEINSKIASLAVAATATRKYTLYLAAGVYYLEAKIVGKSYVRVLAEPDTVLIPTYTGAADDRENHVVTVDGTLNLTKCNTLLTADVTAGAKSIVVADAGTLAAGDWVVIIGQNAGGQNYTGDAGNSDGAPNITTKDLSQVESVAGTTVNLVYPLTVNHATPGTKAAVQAVAPVIGFEWHGGTFLGCESGVTSANALLVRYAKDVIVDGVKAKGFTRHPIEVIASSNYQETGTRSLGTNNSWAKYESVTGKVTDTGGVDGVPRYHPTLGYPRDLITVIGRCADLEISDSVIQGGCIGGIFASGGLAPRLSNIVVRNMEVDDAAYTRWLSAPEINGSVGYFHALGIGMGHGDLTWAEFAHGLQMSNVTIDASTFRIPASWEGLAFPRAWCAYLHDSMRGHITDLTVINHGGFKPGLGGIRWSDIEGDAVNVLSKGLGYMMFTQNVHVDVRFVNLRTDPVCASGVAPGPAIYMDHTSVAGNGPTIYGWKHSSDFDSGQNLIYFGTAFVASEPSYPDNRFTVHDLERDGGRWEYVHFAMQVASFAMYDIVEIDPTYASTGLMRVRTPVTTDAGYEKRLVTIVAVHNSNIVTIAPLPQARTVVKCSSAAVAYGDNLVYDAANPKRLKADNTAGGLAASVGTAYGRKAAGAEGVVRMGD